MDAHQLAKQFLESVAALENCSTGKWAFTTFKTSHGFENRNGFLDACSELFVPFTGQPKPVIYEAMREALRQAGTRWIVQRYAGMVLLNLVTDAYGQVDELLDIVGPVFDVSNGEIPAFFVEQVGIEPLLRKIEARKKKEETNPAVIGGLNGLAYQAKVYQNRKRR